VIVLGIDGMDHGMLETFIAEGRLPNFARLAQEGDFSALETTMPPLSPVAWSTFITGMDPAGHGVFDFLQRDPETMDVVEPFYTFGPEGFSLDVGSWVLPLSGGDVELYRRGQAFWELLDDAGVDTTIFRMPVNFPPVETGGRTLTGMGTPDFIGGHGTYSYFTDYPPDDMTAMTGHIEIVEVVNDRVEAELHGPPHPFKREPVNRGGVGANGEVEYEYPDLVAPFEVFVDPEAAVAKIVIQDTELVLNEGEWSDWVRVDFDAIPYVVGLSSIGRFYLQEVRPDFKLYVTPLQINPEQPHTPISGPEDWSEDLHDVLGPFYTQELPEETKAFSEGVFSGREFWEQSQFVYTERRRALDHVLDTFEDGLLFFYFGSVDQGSHMLFHFADTEHPMHEPDELLRNGIRTLYEEMDEALGRVLDAVDDDTTLIVMSDHGFAPFYWGVNLNTWLLEQGYVTLKDPTLRGRFPMFVNVDWSRTRAYAFGMGGVYVNLRGREREGIVEPGAEYDRLLDELERDLLAMVDERTGANPISLIYQTRDQFAGPHLGEGPDIIVGYSRGYRYSWDGPLGEFGPDIIVDNDDEWSGDHTNDYRLVPGVLLTNQRISLEAPALHDLTVAVLDEFGVAPLPEMIGEDTIEAR
jgi:predicted AlkP superfamily phosphohydrolase/phosphomutase